MAEETANRVQGRFQISVIACSLSVSVLSSNGAGFVTFSADRGHHFTGDLTE